jgi:hypothetical protein
MQYMHKWDDPKLSSSLPLTVRSTSSVLFPTWEILEEANTILTSATSAHLQRCPKPVSHINFIYRPDIMRRYYQAALTLILSPNSLATCSMVKRLRGYALDWQRFSRTLGLGRTELPLKATRRSKCGGLCNNAAAKHTEELVTDKNLTLYPSCWSTGNSGLASVSESRWLTGGLCC